MTTSGQGAPKVSVRQIELEFQELRLKLNEAEQTLDAIRSGEVDALVVYGDSGEKVYTLKGADEPYRVFVEQMQEAALTIGPDGLILYCNQRLSDMLEHPLETLIGSQVQEILQAEDHSVFDAFLAKADEKPPSQALSLKGPHGSISVQVSIAPLGMETGDGYALIMTDLTAQKEHEKALEAANEELEGFCYSVSHDLRTPLRAMITSSRILVEDFGSVVPDAAADRLRRIEASAKTLGRLIDDLLSFARLGKLHISHREVDLSRLVEEIRDEFSDFPRDRFIIEPGLVTTGDAQLLQMALHNLISNAIKFTRSGSELLVHFGREVVDGQEAFFVRDKGIGFEMEYAARIFKPFERLHPSEVFPGTGIGLANVDRIVSRHGGKIWAVSNLGEGSTFYFTIATEGEPSPAN